ncbi:hypothetical protein [Myroides marinus]|uniref:hypothetical protein n=1 Tax=Myroides marinus TaxID=703342 RepID=UPI002576CDD0|nr:hypothetical protein [Myroides marinus]MDM1346485.1 hypothetical protein [Myroides marinus]MDM1349904.1 hypothetical protein [Myroides marinus]MDM1357112.1 hypothetical protein [Myroides marinus]
MDKKITIYNQETLTVEAIREADNNYKYQAKLTPKLDALEGDFNQGIINEIVLWKVNRYAEIDESILKLLNVIDRNNIVLDVELTKEIMNVLLNCPGVQLAMASTILRFKNPHVYQILDQRVFRFIYGVALQEVLKKEKDQVKVYLCYLRKLKEVCNELSISFEDSDRILYELDKKFNKDIKLKY